MMISATQMDRRGDLRSFLKALRGRLDRDARVLGKYERLNARQGRAVSQEELAEATGVSRVWYSMLENGIPIRPSPSMLNRIATALEATPEERATLFRLAIPALNDVLTAETATTLESLSIVRAASKRLWQAGSVDEAMTIASEHLAEWFEDASLVASAKRVSVGQWEWSIVVDRGLGTAWAACMRDICGRLMPFEVDELANYPESQLAGEVADDDASLAGMAPKLRRLIAHTYDRRRLDLKSFIRARVSTRHGVIGCIHVTHKTGRAYTELDREIVSAMATLASLAVSSS